MTMKQDFYSKSYRLEPQLWLIQLICINSCNARIWKQVRIGNYYFLPFLVIPHSTIIFLGLKRPYETMRPASPNRQSQGTERPLGRTPSSSLLPNPALNNNNNTSPDSSRNVNGTGSPMTRNPSKPNLKVPPLSPPQTSEDQSSPSLTKKPSDAALNERQITKKASESSLNFNQVPKTPSDPALSPIQVNEMAVTRPTPPTTPRGNSGTLRKQPSVSDVNPSSPTPPSTTPRGNSGTLRKQPSVSEMNANQMNSLNTSSPPPNPAPRRPSDASRNGNDDLLRKQPSSSDLNSNNQISSTNSSNTTLPMPRRPSDPKAYANQIIPGSVSSPRLSDASSRPPLNLSGSKYSPSSSANASPDSSKTSSPRDAAANGPNSAPPINRRISTLDESHAPLSQEVDKGMIKHSMTFISSADPC